MGGQGDGDRPEASGEGQADDAQPAKLEVKADCSIVGAIGAGDGSETRGTVNIAQINAQNLVISRPRGASRSLRASLAMGFKATIAAGSIGLCVSGVLAHVHGIRASRMTPTDTAKSSPVPDGSTASPGYRGVLRQMKTGQPMVGARVVLAGTHCVAGVDEFGVFDFTECRDDATLRLTKPKVNVAIGHDEWDCQDIPLKPLPAMTEILLAPDRCNHEPLIIGGLDAGASYSDSEFNGRGPTVEVTVRLASTGVIALAVLLAADQGPDL